MQWWLGNPRLCFNALNGLLSFLLDTPRFGGSATVFQRPERASFISTYLEYTDGKNFYSCFNALNGLLSFLQPERLSCHTAQCFNALNGLLSFLRYPLRTRINTGFAGSFLQVFVFSTVPSQNPHKHWLCRLIFAGICLKILKSSFFAHFLARSQFVHIFS